MIDKKQADAFAENKPLSLPRWYNTLLIILVALSLFGLKKGADKGWEVSLGINQITPVIIALAIFPQVLSFLSRRSDKGAIKLLGCEFTWENKKELDNEILKEQEKHKDAGDMAKTADSATTLTEGKSSQREADAALEQKVKPHDLPVVRQIYVQELHDLVKKYNRNRHLRQKGKNNAGEADEIAYRIRTIAPFLFGQFAVKEWLNSNNPGQRLSAIKYLDWAQDIEHVDTLLALLFKLKADTFQQFHILLALSGMCDQLAYDLKSAVHDFLKEYDDRGDVHLARLKRLLEESTS